ncbi:hypothetical protein [Ulvibacterium sp.]|uniref:hypothetical protein n=1 Tax=Ulvibacterium sp. TaxID=2665914 RepID=UPI002627B87F|nr:hypothetical protein [Ulvibacterium sp.]
MTILKSLILILFVLLSINGLKAQNSDQNWEILKNNLKENKTPNWNHCFIDGRLEFQSLTDSINNYSILLPKNYSSTTYKNDKYIVYQYNPTDESNENPILEIKIGPVISEKIDVHFDKALSESVYSKSFRHYGKIELNENESYWIESQKDKKSRMLSFYLINQETNRIFILTINSFKKRKSASDYCIFTNYFKNIEWIK